MDVPLKIVSLPVFELVLAMSNICSIVHIQKLIRYNSNYSLLFTLFFEINIAASALAYILPLFMLFPDSDVECCCTFRRLHFSSLPPSCFWLFACFIHNVIFVCLRLGRPGFRCQEVLLDDVEDTWLHFSFFCRKGASHKITLRAKEGSVDGFLFNEKRVIKFDFALTSLIVLKTFPEFFQC